MTNPKSIALEPALSQRWLSIVGIGEDGIEGLSPGARGLIQNAEIVFGGLRHLALATSLIRGEAKTWPSPFSLVPALISGLRGRQVCVLASGDPFFYGVGATLAAHIPADETFVIPAPSSFSLAAARMGWPLQETTLVSVHGRGIDRIRPHLHPGAHILALTSDREGPGALAALLTQNGFGRSSLTVLEALGGPRERMRTDSVRGFALRDVADLNIVAIEVVADKDARILPFTPGLDDELFEHDGQITKREIRAVTLSSLGPRHGELLWDVGTGCGSIGIEWLLAHPSLKAYAIEADPKRAARAERNKAAFGVPHLDVIEGRAPDALAGLPKPDAIFIGGGGSGAGVIETCMEALKPGGRLVANAVTLETESELIAHQAAQGGSLTRLSVARADAIGGMTGWRPAMPVTQWRWEKT